MHGLSLVAKLVIRLESAANGAERSTLKSRMKERTLRDWRKRLSFFVSVLIVMAMGLASRRFRHLLPPFLGEYSGDTLWALMVFLGISFLLPNANLWRRIALALGFAYVIEVSQLYHAPWIDSIRNTTLGGLVLGFGFLWSDFVCYTMGIGAGAGIELLFRKRIQPSAMTETSAN